ncbi:MAG: cyclopropane fatty acyl phospholipid synthase [Spirochaetaceae bacterium]|nr:MAG: cyclopropane fatty acyl phospholipid synthase [Spirochaetaceae bacterium]
MSRKAKPIALDLLQLAGITVDGPHPWDMQVHDQRLYARVMGGGSLALGESYMDGWWDTPSIDQFIQKLFEAQIEKRVKGDWQTLLVGLKCRYTNPQVIRRAYEIGKRHYDTGNDLFRIMLDRRMVYSCGYWRDARNLDQAQEAKLDLICRKLELEPGMTLLDIGCGWGSLLQFAAERYGVTGAGVTVSREQAELASERCRDLPVTIKLDDYRSVEGQYDRVASVGMVEHVGWRNYTTFMRVAHRLLKPGGLFLLHTIGNNVSSKEVDPWVERYIFPNSMLPALAQLTSAAEPYFIAEDLHNFGPYYDLTLLEWDRRFREGWSRLADRYGERFYRMWRFYLLSSAASFRVRRIQLWQLLLSKGPRPRVARRVE